MVVTDVVAYSLSDPMNRGWQEAIQLMKEGATWDWELYIPSELGYGNNGSGKIPPRSVLIFTLQLISVRTTMIYQHPIINSVESLTFL